MNNRATTRRGVSLIEVAAAAAIMGLVALFAVSSVRFSSLGNYGAEVDTRDLASQLRDARRRTIATGDNHVLVLRIHNGVVAGYHLHRRESGRRIPVREYRPASREVVIRSSTPLPPEFTFEGNALRSQTFDIAGPNRSWRIFVTQAGGGVVVQPR